MTTNFFSQLAAIIGEAHLSIAVSHRKEIMSLTIIPKKGGVDDLKTPLVISANPAELDEVFFEKITEAMTEVTTSADNLEKFKTETKKAGEVKAEAKTTDSKPAPKPSSKGTKKGKVVKKDKADRRPMPKAGPEEPEKKEAAPKSEPVGAMKMAADFLAQKNYTDAISVYNKFLEGGISEEDRAAANRGLKAATMQLRIAGQASIPFEELTPKS